MSSTDYARQVSRFRDLDRTLSIDDGVTGISHAEDYVPPHKSAGFVPYDALLALDSADWDVEDVEALLDTHDLAYNRVITVGPNDSRHGGPTLAFISLVDPS